MRPVHTMLAAAHALEVTVGETPVSPVSQPLARDPWEPDIGLPMGDGCRALRASAGSMRSNNRAARVCVSSQLRFRVTHEMARISTTSSIMRLALRGGGSTSARGVHDPRYVARVPLSLRHSSRMRVDTSRDSARVGRRRIQLHVRGRRASEPDTGGPERLRVSLGSRTVDSGRRMRRCCPAPLITFFASASLPRAWQRGTLTFQFSVTSGTLPRLAAGKVLVGAPPQVLDGFAGA